MAHNLLVSLVEFLEDKFAFLEGSDSVIVLLEEVLDEAKLYKVASKNRVSDIVAMDLLMDGNTLQYYSQRFSMVLLDQVVVDE